MSFNLHQLEIIIISSFRTLNDHCDGVATELDWLQDQLNNGGLSMDSSALLGVGQPGQLSQLSQLGQLGHVGLTSEENYSTWLSNMKQVR